MANNRNADNSPENNAQANNTSPENFAPVMSAEVIAALKAEIRDELRAELEKEKAAVAEKTEKPVAKKDDSLEEYVEVRLFKDGKRYKDDVFLCVNGENCVVQRGVPVKIKRKFAIVLEQSMKQDLDSAEYSEARTAEFEAGRSSFAI